MVFKEILFDFEECLKHNLNDVYNLLQPGISYSKISSSLNDIGIVNNKLIELYQWHNGINYNGETPVSRGNFFSNGQMLPLERALIHYDTHVSIKLWKNEYFPIFSNNSGDYILYDTNRDSSTFGMLLLFAPTVLLTPVPQTIYDSIESVFTTILACFRDGIYKYDKMNKELEIDFDLEGEISSKTNPRSDFWRK
ncbi:SMI1/KNR4 family protein [Chitinophaga defluvii]|uniref:SMI1/KNR4 family protein n=1 Tax=Chitinophaga defluvii TaxID=3163343 RepID=A0ABV2T207_9BACT